MLVYYKLVVLFVGGYYIVGYCWLSKCSALPGLIVADLFWLLP